MGGMHGRAPRPYHALVHPLLYLSSARAEHFGPILFINLNQARHTKKKSQDFLWMFFIQNMCFTAAVYVSAPTAGVSWGRRRSLMRLSHLLVGGAVDVAPGVDRDLQHNTNVGT